MGLVADLNAQNLSLNAYHFQGSRPMARIYRFLPCFLIVAAVVVGCSKQDSSKQFLSMGTAPVGGAFPVVGGAIAEVLNEHKQAIDWKVQAKGTKGSQENIRRLQQNDLELALSNAAISFFAARGEGTWDKKYDIPLSRPWLPTWLFHRSCRQRYREYCRPEGQTCHHGAGWSRISDVHRTDSC